MPGLRIREVDVTGAPPVFDSNAPVTADDDWKVPVTADEAGNAPVAADDTWVTPSDRTGKAPVLTPDVRTAPHAVQRSSEAGTSRPQSGQFIKDQAIMGLFGREGQSRIKEGLDSAEF